MIYIAIAVSSVLSALFAFSLFIYYIKRMDKQMITAIEVSMNNQVKEAEKKLSDVAVILGSKGMGEMH